MNTRHTPRRHTHSNVFYRARGVQPYPPNHNVTRMHHTLHNLNYNRPRRPLVRDERSMCKACAMNSNSAMQAGECWSHVQLIVCCSKVPFVCLYDCFYASIFATLRNSLTPVTVHCICSQLIGTIVFPAVVVASMTPKSLRAVDKK